MIARRVLEMIEDLKIAEERILLLQEYLKELNDEKLSIELKLSRKPSLKLYPVREVAEEIVDILIKSILRDYEKNLEKLRMEGIKVTNLFEKKKIEKEIDDLNSYLYNEVEVNKKDISNYQKELDKIIELENKLKEI